MIVDAGKLTLLGMQVTALQTCSVGLFSSNTTITSATVLADLTESAFTSYARQTVSTLTSPAIVSTRAQVTPVTLPTFHNGSGSGANIYGWFFTNVAGTEIISATNIGLTVIPAGQDLAIQLRITNTEE